MKSTPLKKQGRVISFFRTQTATQAALALTVISILSKPMGLLREMVIAQFFGATAVTDAFYISQTLPNLFAGLVAGALISSFIPIFIRVKEHDEARAWQLASRTFTLLILALVVISALLYFFAEGITRVLAPGFDSGQVRLTAWLSRYMIPVVFLGTMLGLFTAILNAYRHFLLPALASLLNNVFLIAGVVLLASRLGIVSLVIGSLVAIFAQFIIVGAGLLSQKPYLRLNWRFRDHDLATVFKMMGPVLIGSSAGFLNLLVDRAIASGLATSSISALNYASKIMGIPQGVFIANVATAIFPTLSLHAARESLQELRGSLAHGLSALWYVIIPATAGLVFLAYPIIAAIYQHGAFSQASAFLTSQALLFYSLGLFAHAGNALIGNAFISLKDTITPMKLGLIAVGVNIVLNIILSRFMGASGIALATSIAAFLNFFLLFHSFERKTGKGLLIGYVNSIIKMTVSSLLMGGACFLLWRVLLNSLDLTNYWMRLIIVLAICLLGVILYALFSWLFKIGEFNYYLDYLRKIIDRFRGLLKRS